MERADRAVGRANIATTTVHPNIILRSMTILSMSQSPLSHSETSIQNIQMTYDLISDTAVTPREIWAKADIQKTAADVRYWG
jgi:hypothetical protein